MLVHNSNEDKVMLQLIIGSRGAAEEEKEKDFGERGLVVSFFFFFTFGNLSCLPALVLQSYLRLIQIRDHVNTPKSLC